MRAFLWLRSLWWNLAHRGEVERALDDEVRGYVDQLTADYGRRGLAPAAARRAALVETGGIEQVKESTRDAWIGNLWSVIARDLLHALRTLERSRGFVVIVIATLAVGIGGTTAVFTMIDAVLLRPLPGVAQPERLITLERTEPRATLDDFGYPDFVDYRSQSRTLAGLAAFNGTPMILGARADTTRAWVSYVSGDFFAVLGARPALGRFIGPNDVTAVGANPVAVLGYGLWRQRFAGDSQVVGTTLTLNGERFMVIGVASPGFAGAMRLHPMEIWIPVTMLQRAAHVGSHDILRARGDGWFRLVGRLAPGKTVADAQRELSGIAAHLATEYATNKDRGVRVFGDAGMTRDERTDAARLPYLLALAVALLLVMACASVAGLLLLRFAAKRRELATRVALGASSLSLVRQVVLESALLGGAGTIAGLGIARALVSVGSIVQPVVGFRNPDIAFDGRVLAVAVVAAVFTTLIVSLFPAIQISRTDIGLLMKDGAGGAVRRRSRGQRALVVFQVAVSLTLLASAAIVYGAFRRTLAIDPGFATDGLQYAYVDAESLDYDSTRARVAFRALLARASTDPAIADAALTSTIPPQEWSTRVSVFRSGEEPPPGALDGNEFGTLGLRAYVDAISANMLQVMKIPVELGRGFTSGDDEHSEPVVIVSRRLAEALWPRQNAVGKYLAWPAVRGAPRPPLRVVGVAADTRHASLIEDPPPLMYVPFTQHPEIGGRYVFLVVRGRQGSPVSPERWRRILSSIDPRFAVEHPETMRDHLETELGPERTASWWIGVFGVVALLLASIGLYGVVSQSVLQRVRELAVRTALGATPRALLALVLGEGMRLALTGSVLGALGATAALRVLRSQFPAVRTLDVEAAVVAAGVLALAMFAATYLPARRASRLAPAEVLRSD
jgi:predicted permease